MKKDRRPSSLIEFLDLAKVVGFDPYEVLRHIEAVDQLTD
ncbi:hypothetical protein X727_14055 [Mesorhizobium sp. L103C119B0]|nr:hypothetical protein X727_14055 [Mesorhizobium sp. L103C119B0]